MKNIQNLTRKEIDQLLLPLSEYCSDILSGKIKIDISKTRFPIWKTLSFDERFKKYEDFRRFSGEAQKDDIAKIIEGIEKRKLPSTGKRNFHLCLITGEKLGLEERRYSNFDEIYKAALKKGLKPVPLYLTLMLRIDESVLEQRDGETVTAVFSKRKGITLNNHKNLLGISEREFIEIKNPLAADYYKKPIIFLHP